MFSLCEKLCLGAQENNVMGLNKTSKISFFPFSYYTVILFNPWKESNASANFSKCCTTTLHCFKILPQCINVGMVIKCR